MALDINGYNATFKAFTDFATQSVEAGKGKAVARVNVAQTGPLASRTITAAKGDWVGVGQGRLWTLKEANNTARDLFRNAVLEMFGGIDNVPDSVMDAMKMADYGKGKPLTARRILAVKTAIDASGVMKQKALDESKQKAFDESISKFKDQAGMEKVALGKGYSKSELPKIAKGVNLLVQATGCSEAEALEQVTTPGSKANRLVNYGGRFLQSAENFKNGLRLMDSFADWYAKTGGELEQIHKGSAHNYRDGMSKTLLNATSTAFDARFQRGIEKFVFEDLAVNPSFNLAETDGEKLFAMENNPTMSCMAREFYEARVQTFAQVPPEKRSVLFKALTVFCPLYASNAAEAGVPGEDRHILKNSKVGYLTGRILKNLDKVMEMQLNGRLNAANLVKLCFPEIRRPGDDPIGSVVSLMDRWHADMYGDTTANGDWVDAKYSPKKSQMLQDTMEGTGCSIEDACKVFANEKEIPNVPYYSRGSLSIRSLDGTTNDARHDLVGDLDRPGNYSFKDGPPLLKDAGFRFNLPNGETIVTNGTEKGKAEIPKLADKLEELCGKTHVAQASSLLMLTSQSGLAVLRGGLAAYNIDSDEHSSVDFTIIKNDKTGDITVCYTSPKELPFAFEWTATIKPDGFVSTTPLRFTDAETLKTLEKDKADTAEMLKANIYPNGSPETKEAVSKAVDLIVDAARTDRDLMAFLRLKANEDPNADGSFDTMAKKIIVGSSGRIRSRGQILQRLENLRGNLDELRAAANGNQRFVDVGMKSLALFGDKGLPAGVITKMCAALAREDLSFLKELSAESSPEQIFAATCRMDLMIQKIKGEAEVMGSLDGDVGAAENSAVNQLVQGFVFVGCDEKTRAGIKDAFYSESFVKMQYTLQGLDSGHFPEGTRIDPQIRTKMSDNAGRFHYVYLDYMLAPLSYAMGIEMEKRASPDDNTMISRGSFKAITESLEDYTLRIESLRSGKAPSAG